MILRDKDKNYRETVDEGHCIGLNIVSTILYPGDRLLTPYNCMDFEEKYTVLRNLKFRSKQTNDSLDSTALQWSTLESKRRRRRV